jgi:FMN phosphatase YigB (HAD superfamily)
MRTACVIFDVDGTLVDSNAFDDDLYGRAILEVLGPVAIRPAWSDYPHVTDSGILREICQENGLDPGDHEAAVRHRFGQLIEAHLATQGACRAIPGGPTLFGALRKRRGLHVGIATGGWAHTALMKLRAARYEVTGVVLASADDAFVRAEILHKARMCLPMSEMTVYVGDGDWDRRACEVLGWTFVGIGDRVRGRCRHWMPDLSLLDPIDTVLGDP